MSTEWPTNEEAAALHKRFDDLKLKGGGQAEFARKWKIPGGPSMVSQHIKGRRPISLESVAAYAAGFGCSIHDISPRLAREIEKAANVGTMTPSEPTQPISAFTQNPPPAPASIAHTDINNAALSPDALRLAQWLDEVPDPALKARAYAECMGIINRRLDEADRNAERAASVAAGTPLEESPDLPVERQTVRRTGTDRRGR